MTETGDVRQVDEVELREALRSCLGVERFVDEVAARTPFSSNDELLAAAGPVAASLTADEVDAALAHHPRIGERMRGEGRAQAFSRSEQSAADASDEALAAAIAAGNEAYEARFDRVFLVRAAGRGRAEILAELSRRLELDDTAELATVASELRDITMLRLATLFPPTPTTPAPAAATPSTSPEPATATLSTPLEPATATRPEPATATRPEPATATRPEPATATRPEEPTP